MKERICCVCRKIGPVSERVRVGRARDGESYRYFIDERGNANGRGAYVCKTQNCIENCIKKRSLNRTFKGPVPQEVYQNLEDFSKSNEW